MNMSLLVRFKYFFSLVSEAFINILYLSLHILLTVRNENKKAKDFEFIKQLVIWKQCAAFLQELSVLLLENKTV